MCRVRFVSLNICSPHEVGNGQYADDAARLVNARQGLDPAFAQQRPSILQARAELHAHDVARYHVAARQLSKAPPVGFALGGLEQRVQFVAGNVENRV